MSSPIASWLAGRPLALAPRALGMLMAADGLAISAGPAAPVRSGTIVTDGIAVVPVTGPLVSRGDWLTALFGATAYGDLMEALDAAFYDPGVRAVLLEVDTPGGEVGGLFDLTAGVQALKAATGKPLWAVASENALSAGYAIACAADRLYVTRTGEAGSIGVVAAHVDESAADAMDGFKWTLIHAGAGKTDGNPHEPLAQSAAAAIQTDVDALYADFVGLVAANRKLTPEAIRGMGAAIFRGRRAVDAGLADRVGNLSQAHADLLTELDAAPARIGVRRSPAFQTIRSTPAMSSEPEPDAGAGNPPPELAPATSPAPAVASPPVSPVTGGSAETAAAERLRAEYAEIADVAAQAARLGVAVDAADAMRKGVDPAALRRSVLDTLAARADAGAVVAAAPAPAPAPATAGDSPIVRRARERAAAARA
jgi:capsid assembly protease